MIQYPRTFVLLQQEGYLIKGCLTHGLTALRQARVDNKGDVYAAFIQLSIGLERLMKITLVIDHMARHEFRPPSAGMLKKHSHRLLTLFDEPRTIKLDDSACPLDGIDNKSIEWEMLQYLSDFATSTRYFNLDELGTASATTDPLSHWKKVVERIAQEDVPPKQREKAIAKSALLSSLMAEHVVVVANDAHGKPMDVVSAVAQPVLDDIAAPYAVWHMVLLLKKFEALLREVNEFADSVARREGRTDQPVPTMYEFFTFLWHDRAACLSKKAWP